MTELEAAIERRARELADEVPPYTAADIDELTGLITMLGRDRTAQRAT